MSKQAKLAVAAIIKDLEDRSGLQNEWESIDAPFNALAGAPALADHR